MGATDGEVSAADARPSEEPETAPAQDTLAVPVGKRRKVKSPTPGTLRGRSATPIRGRSQTPFNLYLTRRSATPSTWRSITPFLKREERGTTPFELGKDIKTQITCNKAIFDHALIMDITESEDSQKPVRYITTDMSVIDRAAVMDVSNVEVIYLIEEYEEVDEEEIIEEVKPKKKAKAPRKARTPRKSVDIGATSETEGDYAEIEGSEEREESVDIDDFDEPVKKTKKKAAPKKKEKKEKSPSPKLTLKLEMGGGQKASKKMFEDQAAAAPKPPPKKSKLVLQMEEQARQAAKAAEEEAAKASSKPKGETFAERQERLKKEKEEQDRIEAELEALRQQEEAEREAEEGTEHDADEAGEEEDESFAGTESYGGDYGDEGGSEYRDEDEGAEEVDVVPELPKTKKRKGSNDSEEFTRPNPYDEERWQRIAQEEGEEFMQQMRKYSLRIHKSEKERDAEWQRIREQARLPHFIVFLTDRTVEAGHSVRLSCAVGGPELSVKWFKDGRQLERDAKHRIINNNNILVLEVLSTTILDSGEYSCQVANMNDTVASSCYITVYEVFKDEPAPPSCKLMKEYYHLRDDELTIEVHLHGVPRPTVVWVKGGLEIKPSFKFTMLEEAHGVYKLRIYKPNDRDGGTYICKAVNSNGELLLSHQVEVAKNRHFHARGVFHARDRLQRDIELTAKKAMAEAMQSKSASDRKRVSDAAELKERVHRASPEPPVSTKQKLKFATQLRDRMALEGSTVRFVCTVIGPSPSCRWMKDDKWVVAGPTIKNLSEEGKAILELSHITSESSGVYKCIAKNDFSEIETQCYFKVYSAQADGDEQEPMFALPLRDVYHSSQNDLIIDTKVRGNPRPKISWVKDNLPVVLDDRRVQIEHLDGVCELIINKPTTNDSGVYTCTAENKLGSQKTTHTVVVDVVQSSRRSSLLSSHMTESDGEAGAGEAGKADRRESRVPKGKSKADEAEAGTYERRSRMPDVSPKQQLYFIANFSNRYVPIGSKVKFQAVVGGPDGTFKWLKDDQSLTFGPRMRNMSREGHACLEFISTQPEDSGVYTLIAQNEFCKINTSALLHVYSSQVSSDVEPMFTRSLKEIYHIQTNELILETAVRGAPPPTVQWIKDNFEIKSGGRTQILQHQDGTCELIIDRPDAKDSGKYTVRAENSAGKAELLHTVHFTGRACHIAENIHGVFHADKSLLRPKKVEEEEKPAAAAAKEEAGGEAEGEGGDDKDAKGRRKSKVKKPKKEEEDTSASATEIVSDAGSLKKREKVIGIHFATSVRDRVVAEGSKVKISCFLESKEPQVKWFKNDEQIQNTPKIRGRHMEGLCLLEITSATIEDSGVYKCWARDETGEASTFCKLEVYADPGTGDVPPTFTRNIKDTYHGKINELQLDVHVRGLPTPTVTWVKDGVKCEPSEKYQQIDHDDGLCELFIMDPVPADSGKYVCQAENREGKAEITHIVTVEARQRRPVSPSREARPPVKPQTEEEEAAAEGETEGGEGGEKKKKRKPKDDEEGGGSGRREAPPPPDLKKYLYLRNYLSNRTVKAGSNVKWMVSIDGPEATARWFHGDQPISFGPKSKMSCQDGIAWLNLIGVTEEEAGEYTLKVKGSENEVVSTCQLFVYTTGVEEVVAPVFTVGIKDTYTINENTLVLDCRVRGKPRPDIQWMKGNDLINDDDRYNVHYSTDGYVKLVINNPTEKDSGLYACVARNEGAENKITHHVDFAGRERFTLEKTHGYFHRNPNKPHFLMPLSNQTVCPGGTVAITAQFMNSATPLDVQWLRDHRSVAGQPGIETFMEGGVYTLAILNAQPEAEGTYTCRASNAFGRIESHVSVDVAAGVEKSERPPLFLSRPETEMKIMVGDPFSISFRIAADPKPKLTFLKGTKDITKSDRVSKEVSDDYTRFTMQGAQVADSGTYFVVARNEFGTDRVFVTITVKSPKRKESSTSHVSS